MKIIICFSGGKDSQACLIRACHEFGAKNIEAVFCDTGWEHEITYEHVKSVVRELDVKLVTLRASFGGFHEMCCRMKWFPDTTHRMCTVQLKIYPMIDYILKQNDDLCIIQGIRSAESASRARLSCSADYFAQYKEKTTREQRLYRVQDVREWCHHHSAVVERPFFGASAQDVIDYILESGQRPNPLYERGVSRVGCYPCIYARLAELKLMRKDKFYVKRVQELEYEVNNLRSVMGDNFRKSSFFQVGKIPARFCREYGSGIPSFGDVMAYVSRDDAQLDLFDSEGTNSCMSIYHGLCE